MLHPGELKVGDFVRPVASNGNKEEGGRKGGRRLRKWRPRDRTSQWCLHRLQG